VPGVKPPAGTESDEIRRRTCGPASATPAGTTVDSADGSVSGVPHVRQNRLSAGDSVAHDGHRTGRVASVTVAGRPPDYSRV
jgi:hypothetical protein